MSKILSYLQKNKLNSKGFTLIELMIVVAIIGILSAIAIPNYQRYQARSRQTEARLNLSGLYTAEQTYVVDSSTFGACINAIGFSISSGPRFYTTGFSDAIAGGATCGPAGGAACTDIYDGSGTGVAVNTCVAGVDVSHFAASTGVGAAATTEADLGATALSNTAFTAQSVGRILSGGGPNDAWTINETKTLSNTVSGI